MRRLGAPRIRLLGGRAGPIGHHRLKEQAQRTARQPAGGEGGRRPQGLRGPELVPPGFLQPEALGHERVPRPAPEALPAATGRVRVPVKPAPQSADILRQPSGDPPRAAARHVSRHRRRTRLRRGTFTSAIRPYARNSHPHLGIPTIRCRQGHPETVPTRPPRRIRGSGRASLTTTGCDAMARGMSLYYHHGIVCGRASFKTLRLRALSGTARLPVRRSGSGSEPPHLEKMDPCRRGDPVSDALTRFQEVGLASGSKLVAKHAWAHFHHIARPQFSQLEWAIADPGQAIDEIPTDPSPA